MLDGPPLSNNQHVPTYWQLPSQANSFNVRWNSGLSLLHRFHSSTYFTSPHISLLHTSHFSTDVTPPHISLLHMVMHSAFLVLATLMTSPLPKSCPIPSPTTGTPASEALLCRVACAHAYYIVPNAPIWLLFAWGRGGIRRVMSIRYIINATINAYTRPINHRVWTTSPN